MIKKFVDGLLAGLMISIGGAAFLMCLDGYKAVGAFLFTIGLLTVCLKGYSLYTGKIGLLFEKHSKDDILVLVFGLLGNGVASLVVGYLLGYAIPQLHDAALSVCTAKLEQGYLSSFIRAVFCGVLIYVAVDIFANHKSPLGVILGIPAFIMSGFEHSIADMFYFSATIKGLVFWKVLVFIVLIILGNSIGGLVIPSLKWLGNLKKPAQKSASCEIQTSPENQVSPGE